MLWWPLVVSVCVRLAAWNDRHFDWDKLSCSIDDHENHEKERSRREAEEKRKEKSTKKKIWEFIKKSGIILSMIAAGATILHYAWPWLVLLVDLI